MKTKGVVVLISLALCCVSIARGQKLEWTRQLGTSELDWSQGVSADGLGNIYVSGSTDGSLEGVNAGGRDAFLSKYDAGGTIQWIRQLGTSENDTGFGVSADGLGNIYISGWTSGGLEGPFAGGFSDAFLSKYDANGAILWTRQLGTSERDQSNGVAADVQGNVFISGYTNGSLEGPNGGSTDAFLCKYDASGSLQWMRQIGSSRSDLSRAVSADALGNVYISGHTRGSLQGTNAGRFDAFVSKYDANGAIQWTQQLGTSENDISFGVTADGLGNIFVSGTTDGNLEGASAGGQDVFLAKYDASGKLAWTQQLGTSENDQGFGVTADGLGSVYVAGRTYGNLEGTNSGEADAFISKYDANGMLLWTRQPGTSESDTSWSVSADGLGNVYISGDTQGSLGGPNAGGRDAFVAKYSDSQETLLGDVNLDGIVDGLDVGPFVDVLLSGPYQSEADVNADQVVNGLDVDPFVAAVVGGGTHSIPEPSTLLLGVIAVGLVLGWRKRDG